MDLLDIWTGILMYYASMSNTVHLVYRFANKTHLGIRLV